MIKDQAPSDIENSPKHDSPKETAPILDGLQKQDTQKEVTEKEGTTSTQGINRLLTEVKKLSKVVQ